MVPTPPQEIPLRSCHLTHDSPTKRAYDDAYLLFQKLDTNISKIVGT